MRHGKKFNHLGRKVAHRKAMLSNMAISLIMHKRIKTTVAKAKALRVYVEPLITKSKEDSTHSRRVVFSYLQNKHAVSELFREISPKIADRPGGYTRILKIGNRLGDNAEMCMIELVDYNENMLTEKKTKDKSTRKRRRGGSKTVKETAAVETVENTTEEVKEEVEVKETVKEEKPVEEKKVEAKETVEEEKPVEEKKVEAKEMVKEEKPVEEKKVEAKEVVKEEKPVEEKKAKVKEVVKEEKPVEEKKEEQKEEKTNKKEDKE